MEQANEVSSEIIAKIKTETVLFFDLDGTLVDTNLANYQSFKKAIRSVVNLNLELDFNPNRRFNRSNLKIAFPNLSKIEYERIIQDKEKYYKDFLHETKLNQVLSDLLFEYSKTNKTVLVTNCRKDRAIMTLNYHGLTDKFSSLFFRTITTNDEKINKFKNAIQSLKISSDMIIVFENEKTEIEDAVKAGINNSNIIRL